MSADNEIARLLEQARRADLPDQARLDRVRERLLPKTADLSQPVEPQPSRALRAPRFALAAKLGVGLGVVVLAGTSATLLLRDPAPPRALAPAAPESAPTAPPQAESTPPVAASGSAAPEPRESRAQQSQPTPRVSAADNRPVRRKQSAKSDPPPSASAAGSAETDSEAALLRNAVLYLRNGNLDRARSSLAEVQRRFPESQLQAERERLMRWLARLEAQHETSLP